MVNLGRDGSGYLARAASAKTRSDSDVLPAANAERNRVSLRRSSQSRLPQCLASLDINGSEYAIQIADECYAACRGKHRGEEGCALLERPRQ